MDRRPFSHVTNMGKADGVCKWLLLVQESLAGVGVVFERGNIRLFVDIVVITITYDEIKAC